VTNKGELIFSYFEDKKPRVLKGSIGIFGMGGSIKMLYENQFFTPNGIAFDGNNEELWCADTGSSLIYKINFKKNLFNNCKFGSEVIKVIKVDSIMGRPDGANLDAFGNYWVALHDGGRLGIWSPNGKMIGQLMLLEAKPTMVCFSGELLDKIDVTFKCLNEEDSAMTGILSKPSGISGGINYKFWDC
jgi:sugar lactone lactonase YvrE